MKIKMVVERLSMDLKREITEHRIRNYDRIGLIEPAREDNNYRRFTDKDYARLRTAILLSDSVGVSMEIVDMILNKKDKDASKYAVRKAKQNIKDNKNIIDILE